MVVLLNKTILKPTTTYIGILYQTKICTVKHTSLKTNKNNGDNTKKILITIWVYIMYIWQEIPVKIYTLWDIKALAWGVMKVYVQNTAIFSMMQWHYKSPTESHIFNSINVGKFIKILRKSGEDISEK